MKICIAGKCHLPCPKGHQHERSIKKYYSRQVSLWYSRDGVPWGMENDICRQYSLFLRFGLHKFWPTLVPAGQYI
jgi:hypothetical protein